MSLFPDETLQVALKMVKENLSKGKYTPLAPELSEAIRNYYREQLVIPKGIIYTPNGLLLAISYQRVVVGDYGAYLEISPEQIIKNNIRIKPGQEFRLNPNSHAKYEWHEPIDGSDVKIYFQLGTVKYADYKCGMYYVSPREVSGG